MAKKIENVVLWLSRHELTEEQKFYWDAIVTNPVFVTVNVTWQATASGADDFKANADKWRELIEKHHPTVILGVFPPVALETRVVHDVPMFSPISRQDAKIREDGSRQIEFVHVRWSGNLNK